MTDKTRYYGKHQGTVLNNVDPEQRGRIQVQVPGVVGASVSTWALPCVPFAGIQTGVFYFPPLGSSVWVEFEGGDIEHPIWVGGFWTNPAEVPVLAAGPPAVQRFVVSLLAQTTLVVSDVPGPTGGFLLKTKSGAMLMINETGITLSNGQGAVISMVGPTVTINGTALAIT